MTGKTMRVVLTLVYGLLIILSTPGLFLTGTPSQAHADASNDAPLNPPPGVDPSTLGTPPAQCTSPDPDPANEIGVELVAVETARSGWVGAPDDGYTTPAQAAPTETVTFHVRLRNTSPTETLFNLDGELTVNPGDFLREVAAVGPTWAAWPGNPGELAPGQTVDGTFTYVARSVDPSSVNYKFWGWGNVGSAGGNQICDSSTALGSTATPEPFQLIGPGLTLQFTSPDTGVEVGDTIQWNLQITNERDLVTDISADDLYFEAPPCDPGSNQIILDNGVDPPGAAITLHSRTDPNGWAATATFSCTMAESYPDVVDNTVTVHATAAGISVDYEASVAVNKLTPSINVTKFADVTEAGPGDTINYTIRVENDGDVQLTNVTVVDTLVGLISAIPSTLDPLQVETVQVQYTVEDTDPDPLINIVTAIGVSPQGNTASANWTATVDKTNPAIELIVTATPSAQLPGQQVTYNFQVTNTGSNGLVGIAVDFPLCTQPGAGAGCTGNNVDLGATSLVPGATTTGTFIYTIQGTEPDPFGFTPETTATATAVTTEGANVSDSASAFVDILDSQLRVTKLADRSSALRGDTITYTITVENLTGSNLDITSITDSLLGPIGSLPQTLGPNDGLPGGSDTYVLNVQYTVTGNDPDPLVNVVQVVTDDPGTPTPDDGPTDSTSAIVDISDAQLFITVTSIPPDEQSPGNDVDYSVGIANIGRVTLTDITGTYEFVGTGEPPTDMAIDFPGPGGPTTSPGVLAPFESGFAAFTRTISSSDPDPLTVLVTIRGLDDQGTERTFLATATINVLPTQLQLTKQANATTAAVGDTITYEFFVENISTETIDNIQLTDDLCLLTTSPGCGTGNIVLIAPYDPGTGTTTGPAVETLSLAPGEQAYGTFDYQVVNSDLSLPDSTLENTAHVEGIMQVSGSTASDADLWQVLIVNPLEIEKTADRAIATPGQTVTYTYTVRNIGGLSDLTDLVVNDSHLGLVGSRPTPLPPGGVWTFDVAYVVLPGDEPGISNVATASGTVNGQSVSANDRYDLEVTEPLLIQKSDNLFGIAVVGDTLTYRIDVMNVSDSPITLNSATDTSNSASSPGPRDLLPGLIANSSIQPGDNVLQPGESSYVEYTYTIGALDPSSPDLLVNTVTIDVTQNGTPATYTTDHEVEVFSPFSILKIPDRTFAAVGQTIHYDYLIYNISVLDMAQVVVTDDHLGPIAVRRHDVGGSYTTAPQYLPALPASPCNPPSCTAFYLESDPAANNYTVRPSDLASDTLTNTVTVRGVEPGGSTIITEEEAEVQVGNPLQVIKTGPPTADVGDTVSYAVQVLNTGQDTITNITAIDSFTGEVTLTYPTTPGTLNSGESATGSVTLTIPQTASDPFVNTITATGDMDIGGTIYQLTAIGEAEIDLNNPILDVTLIGSDSEAERNTTITWTAVLTNNGTSNLTSLTYSDSTGFPIPTGPNQPGECPTDIPAGASITCQWDYTISDTDPDPLENTLHVEGVTGGGQSVVAEDTFTVDLINLLFRVSKSALPNVAFVGDTITYTISVTNSSGTTMTGVTAYDTLTGPVPLTFPSGIDGRLNDTETATATITYTLSQADSSPLINTVSASGVTSGGNTLSDSTYTTVLISSSQLLVEKQASPTVVQIGDQITYNIAITNIGQTRITGLQVSDPAVGLATDGSCSGCTVTTPLTTTALNPFEVAFISYTVDVTTALPDPFVNTVTVTGVDQAGDPVEGSDTVAVDIITPGVSLTKTADRAGAGIGDTVQYTVQLTNVGTADMTGIQVTDNITTTLVPMSYNGGPPTTDPALSTLAPGETAIGVIFYTVTDTTPNPFVNTVTVTTNEGVTDGAAATIEIRNLGISVTKSPQVSSALIGETVTYDITVTNTSNEPLTAVTAIDNLSGLPVTLTFPTTPGELAPGETATGSFDYTIPPSVPDPLLNRVTASGRAPSGVVVSSSAIALVDIREADISLSKTATPGTALIGDTITYTFDVTNEGTSTLTNVQVTDPLCATATAGCTGNQVDLTFPTTPGTLDAGETATGTITRAIAPTDPDPLINTAVASAQTINGATIQDSDSATVQISASPLVVTKTVRGIGDCTTAVPGTVAQVGDTVAYDILVENIGSALISNVSVLDTMTGQLIYFNSFSGTTGALDVGGSAQACITTQVTDSMPDPFVNTVIATGTLGGSTITDTGSASISISNGDLLVTNVPSQPTASIGDTITFTVTVRNTGLSTLTGVTATSPHAGGPIVLGDTTLNPGQSTTGTYSYTISGADPDPFNSTVTVNATAPGPITLTDSATATVDLVSPGLRITKTASPTLAAVGDDITYTITVTNTGTENIENIVVTDVLLGGDITAQFPTVSTAEPLVPGGTVSATLTRTLTSDDGDPVINTAAVTATTASAAVLTDTASASVDVAGSGLTVIKRADVAAAQNGATITYTIEVINTSTTTVSNLTASDALAPSGWTLPATTLAAGERMTASYTHTVDTSVDSDPLINTVTVAGNDSLGVSVSDSSSATVAILDSANIRVTVVPDRATVLATQTINYLVTVTNIGTETLNSVAATASLPDGSNQTLTLSSTTLAPGASATASFAYMVDPADSSPLTATVTASGVGATAGTVTDTGSAVVSITASSLRADLRTVGCTVPCVAVIGDEITFSATIFNDGSTILTNVTLTSPQAITGTNPTGELVSGLIMQPGETHNETFTYLVPLGIGDPLSVEIHVEGTDPVNQIISHDFALVLDTANPRIGVTLSADRNLAPEGTTITYTAEIVNSGDEMLDTLTVIDSLVGSVTDQLSVTSLNPGETTTVTYTHVIQSGDSDPLVNTVTVSGVTDFGRSVADNDTYVVNVQRPELFVTVTADRTIASVGDQINYAVTIVNIGDGPITNLQGSFIVDTSGTGGQQRPHLQGGQILLSLPYGGTLFEGETATGSFYHVATSADPNPLTFRVIVTGQGLVGTAQAPVTDEALITVPLITVDASGNPIVVGTPVPGTADPEVTKSSDQPFAVPGGLVTWTLTVRNPGTNPLVDVIITDTLASNMTLESVTINNGTIESEGNTIVATSGVLEFNQTAVLTIIARVDTDIVAGELIQNLGCATSVGGTTSVCDTAVIRVAPDVGMLPVTGIGNITGKATTASAPIAAVLLVALFLLGMLFGINPNNLDQRTRRILFAAIMAAVIVIAAAILTLVGSFGGSQEAAATTTPGAAATAVAGAPTTAVEPEEATATATATAPSPSQIPPTALPIPTEGPTVTPTATPTPVPPFHPKYERELFIPRLNLGDSVPIVDVPLRNRTWDVRDLGQNIGFLEGTTWVQEASSDAGGNTVLAAHIQITDDVPGPFRDLDLLEVGDSIFVAEQGTIYEFEVYDIDVVAPDDVEVAYPTSEQTLTLITCTAWDRHRGVFAERLVVRARPVRSLSYQ